MERLQKRASKTSLFGVNFTGSQIQAVIFWQEKIDHVTYDPQPKWDLGLNLVAGERHMFIYQAELDD